MITDITPIEFIRQKYGDAFPGSIAKWNKQTNHTAFFDSASLDKLERAIESQKDTYDLYIGLGLQDERLLKRKKKRGSSDTVVALPGFFLDVDFAGKDNGKNYPKSKEDALRILDDFPFKPTAVVHTGNGLHVHFDLIEPHIVQSYEETITWWTAFQRCASDHFRKHGREIDSVGDLVRNWRIPGTFNHKNGDKKPVTLIHYNLDAKLSLAEVQKVVETYKKDTRAKKNTDDFPPANHEAIYENCAWYRKIVVDGASTCPEPDWHAGASITGRCENGESIFHEYSRKHSDYDEKKATYKLERAVNSAGPRTCDNIACDLGHAEMCGSCPHFGQITSPIQLGQKDEKKKASYTKRKPKRYDPGNIGPITLGYTKQGGFVLRDQVMNIIVPYSSNQLMNVGTLIALAPYDFWQERFHKEDGKMDIFRAAQTLIADCKDKGPFNPLTVRGRGVWLEGNREIINLGDPVPANTNNTYLCETIAQPFMSP